MLDIKFIRDNPDKVKDAVKKRGMHFDVDFLIASDDKRRTAISERDELRAKHNDVSREIAELSGAARQEKIEESKKLKATLVGAERKAAAAEEEFFELLRRLPNIPLDDVPPGSGEEHNVVLREAGEKRTFSFEPKDHVALGEGLGILDFETAAKVSGSGFYYLKGAGVLLEFALVHYALEFLSRRGFELVFTPDVARKRFYMGTGYLPEGPEAQTFTIEDSDLGLIATSEVTIAGIHADEILEEKNLPERLAGYSHCFRREAGSYGKYSKGLYRLHQFTKVEMFVYARPEESRNMHLELLELEEELWRGLGVPYRVVEMCAGDLGAQAAKKFDLEAWMPGRGEWGEVTSTSNTTDYQARNLNVRYRTKSGDLTFVHTLNGTALATSRAIIAILENYQNEDGSVRVPDALKPYMNGIEKITYG